MDQMNRVLDFARNPYPAELDNKMFFSHDNANRTVFLADLPKGTSYIEISDFFENKVGFTPSNISIKRPIFKHFYYAYLQFSKFEEAQKVLTEHRFPEIKGVKCRVLAFNYQSPHVTNVQKSNYPEDGSQIFVKNCPSDWTHEDLFKNFEEFGEINSAKVSIDANFYSRGFGFVEFKNAKSAKKAIESMDGKEFDDDGQGKRKLIVQEYESKRERLHGERLVGNNLYVKNFPKGKQDGDDNFSDDDLRKLFEGFGQIVSAVVMKDQEGRSRGFGFVCFKDSRDARKALDAYSQEDQSDTSNRSDQLYVAEAKSKEQRQAELQKQVYKFKMSQMYLNLVIKNLDPSTTEDELKEYFQQFGEIASVKMVQKSIDSNLAFVCFNERESAKLAKERTHTHPFKNRPLYVAYCEPRETRQLVMEEQIDKKMFQKHQLQSFTTKHQELLHLVSSFSMLFQNQNMNNFQRRANSMNMNRNGPFTQPQQQSLNVQGTGMQQRHRSNQNNYRRNYGQGGNRPQNNGQMNGMQGTQQKPLQMQYPLGTFNQMQGQPTPQQQPLTPEQKKALNYQRDIANMFQSQEFMNATAAIRKNVVGNKLYNYITEIVGEQNAPKVTGMILDLEPHELNLSIQTYVGLNQKVQSAMELLLANNLATPPPNQTQQNQVQIGQPQTIQV